MWQDIIHAMPHDAHPMGVLVSAMSALSVFHPDANPALRVSNLSFEHIQISTLNCIIEDLPFHLQMVHISLMCKTL